MELIFGEKSHWPGVAMLRRGGPWKGGEEGKKKKKKNTS